MRCYGAASHDASASHDSASISHGAMEQVAVTGRISHASLTSHKDLPMRLAYHVDFAKRSSDAIATVRAVLYFMPAFSLLSLPRSYRPMSTQIGHMSVRVWPLST